MKVRRFIVSGLAVLGFSTTSFADYDGAFLVATHSHWSFGGWMSYLSDSKTWMNISFPATHNSGATRGGIWSETQSMSIEQQLIAGVRWFDIRVRWEGDQLPLYHGPFYQGQDLWDVLGVMEDFLARYPSESITMRLSQEGESGLHRYSTFGENFERRYRRHKPDLFWLRHKNESRDVELKDIRKKIYLLHDFDPYPTEDGGDFVAGSHYRECDIQDEYSQLFAHQMNDKWEKVKEQIQRANGRLGGNNCYVNYLSATGIMAPFFWAGGRLSKLTHSPRLWTGKLFWGLGDEWPDFPRDCWASFCSLSYPGINTLAKNYLRDHPEVTFVGAMPADFPGDELVSQIVYVNFRY